MSVVYMETRAHSVRIVVTFIICKYLPVRVPIPSLSMFSKGVMCVLYMDTQAQFVKLSGDNPYNSRDCHKL